MEEKISLNLFYMGLISAILAAVISGITFFDAFQNQVKEDLQREGELAAAAYEQYGDLEVLDIFSDDGLRVTLIDEDGTVVYESAADASVMANHRDRPEVAQALKDGNGFDKRTSDTLGTEDYYYARMLSGGQILRVSTSASNIYRIYAGALPYLLGALFALIAVAVLFAVLLTRRLLIPIKHLPEHLDDPTLSDDPKRVYPELRPFVVEIQRQRTERDGLRQEFTANVSHELKTPLTSISGYAEMIENGMAREEDVRRFAGTIRREAGRLLSLISDIIRLSQLDSTEDMPERTSVNLTALARECVETLLPAAEQKGVSLQVEGPDVAVVGEKLALWELTYNLVDNAIRYNRPNGSVRILLSAGTLSVSDTGIGISPDHQDRIFERFYRVDKSHSRQTGGTGLGLSIVKHAAERHGAKISLSSTLGIGTTITVSFPDS